MQARLQEIRDRLNKDTPAPWEIAGCNGELVGINGPSGYEAELGPIFIQLQVYGRNDADFIANSPADIKFLLDALEQLQEEIFFFREEIKEANRQVALHHESEGITLKRLKQSQGRERALRDALQFYANKNNYKATFSKIKTDNGEIAREALKEDKP